MSWPNSYFIARGRNLLIFLFRSVGIQAPRWLWKKMFLDFPSKLLLFKENLTWKYFPIYFYFLKVVISMGLFLTIFCGLFSSVSQTRPPLWKSIIIDDCKFVGNPCVAKMKKCPPPGGGGPKKKTSRSWDRWRTNVPQSFHNIFHTVKDGELHPSLQIISLRSWPFYDYTINPFPQPTNLNHLALRQPIPINLLIHMRI